MSNAIVPAKARPKIEHFYTCMTCVEKGVRPGSNDHKFIEKKALVAHFRNVHGAPNGPFKGEEERMGIFDLTGRTVIKCEIRVFGLVAEHLKVVYKQENQ